MFTKRFEKKHTAWMDGQLPAGERELIESRLGGRAAAEKERMRWNRIRETLKTLPETRPLPHADMLNTRIRQRISQPNPLTSRPRSLAWRGAMLVAISALIGSTVISRLSFDRHPAMTEVLESQVRKDHLAAAQYRSPKGKAAVIWLTGVDYIPANEVVR